MHKIPSIPPNWVTTHLPFSQKRAVLFSRENKSEFLHCLNEASTFLSLPQSRALADIPNPPRQQIAHSPIPNQGSQRERAPTNWWAQLPCRKFSGQQTQRPDQLSGALKLNMKVALRKQFQGGKKTLLPLLLYTQREKMTQSMWIRLSFTVK